MIRTASRRLGLLLALILSTSMALSMSTAAALAESTPAVAKAPTPASASTPAPASAPAPTGSVLGYQCGQAVCVIAADNPKAKPRQVVPSGRFAGVTANGKTIAWVQPSGDLVKAPVAGGAPTVVYTGSVGTQVVMSPDGSRFLWLSPIPVYGFYYTMRLDVASGEVVGVSSCACVPSHGWAGSTPIAAYPSSGQLPSRICLIGTNAETGTSSSCGRVLASDPRGQLSFPDGTADRQTFVAPMDPQGSAFGGSEGPLGLYSGSTAALIKDLTSHPTDSTPTLSLEGDRVAFDRDGTIRIVDVKTGDERVVGPGFAPSWGGARSEASAISPKGKKLRYRAGKIKAALVCAGAKRCRGRASVGKGKKVFAKRSYSVAPGRTKAIKLKATKLGKRKLKGNGRMKVNLRLRASDGTQVRFKVKLKY